MAASAEREAAWPGSKQFRHLSMANATRVNPLVCRAIVINRQRPRPVRPALCWPPFTKKGGQFEIQGADRLRRKMKIASILKPSNSEYAARNLASKAIGGYGPICYFKI